MKRALLTLSLGAVLVWSFLHPGAAQVVPQPGPPQAIACAYNSSPPTLTNGQAGWVQCDNAGQIKTTSSGGGGGAVTIADGADVTEGAIADAAATAGSTGTVSAKLRLITSQLNTIATSVAAATPAGANIIGYTTNDPCTSAATKISFPISQATSTQIISGTSAKKTYICSLMLIAADAENISLVMGTGSVCATGIAAVIGGTTAANGPNLASNGGFAWGNGASTIASGVTNADNVCLLQSASGRVAGVLTYVQQ